MPRPVATLSRTGPEIPIHERVMRTLERLERIRSRLPREAAAALLSTRRDIAWVTLGAEAHVVTATETAVAPLLVTRDRAAILTPVNEARRIAEEEVSGLPIEVLEIPWEDPEAGGRAAGALVGGTASGAAGRTIVRGDALEELMRPLRMALEPPEHARLRWLGAWASEGFRVAEHAAKDPLATEASVAAALLTPLAEAGIRVPVLLAATGPRLGRYRHPLPTDRPVEARLMLVVVAERWGLHAAGTRMIDRDPRAAEVARGDAAVRRVLDAIARASTPGATLGDVFDAAREAYALEGVPDEWRLHHQGGTIGYQGRERLAVPGDPTTLEPGMAVAWNPSIGPSKAEATWILAGDGRLETVLS